VLGRVFNDRLLNLAVAAARAALWHEPGALGHELVVAAHLRTSLALRRVLNKTSLPFQNPPKFKQIQVKFFQVVARKESLMIGISLAAGATFVWFVSLPADQLLHHPRMNPTAAIAAEAQRVQERFEQERNAEIDASIAAVVAQRAQERFEQERNAEIDASIAAVAE
jgi:hypothetical protein